MKRKAAMDAPDVQLHFAAYAAVQNRSTGKRRSRYFENFLRITIFQNFQIAGFDPLTPPSVENGRIGQRWVARLTAFLKRYVVKLQLIQVAPSGLLTVPTPDLTQEFNVKRDDVMSMTHGPNYLKYIVQMQVYKMTFICWFNAIVGLENDQLLKSSIYSVYYIQ